jgi:YbgC/YbaW family acyl-CoA thioester hydrolase
LTHEKRIEIRWRDQDAYRHVNNAVYATYLEECRDEWAERVLQGVGDVWDYVLARVAIDFRQELTQEDGAVIVSCTLEGIGTSSLTLRESIRKLDGTLSAEAEAVLVARDRTTGRSRPLTDAEREALLQVLPPDAVREGASYNL